MVCATNKHRLLPSDTFIGGGDGGYTVSDSLEHEGWQTDSGHYSYTISKENAEFIAEFRNAWPQILAALEEAKVRSCRMNRWLLLLVIILVPLIPAYLIGQYEEWERERFIHKMVKKECLIEYPRGD